MGCIIECLAVILALVGWIRETHAMSYDYNCTGTFIPNEGLISCTSYISPTTCVWLFNARPGSSFILHLDYFVISTNFVECLSDFLEIRDGPTEVSPLLFGPECRNRTDVPRTIRGNSTYMWIRYRYDRSAEFVFEASIEMDTPTLSYRVHDVPVSWFEARDTCAESGGSLPGPFPVMSRQLKKLMMFDKQYWLGKSVTPWAWLRGCASWSNPDGIEPRYTASKYNQRGECALACNGSVIFLLQNASCYCLDIEQTTVRGLARDCNFRCPGNPREHCGGSDVFTAYQFYDGVFANDDGRGNCVAVSRNQSYAPEFCEQPLGYTCELLNGTKITYAPQFDYLGPLEPLTNSMPLSWADSELFCRDLPGSAGLAPIPYWLIKDPLDFLWTSIVRSLDWYYPTVADRHPDLAYIADASYYYDEEVRNTSTKYGFICEYEIPSCGGNISATSGVVTSPNYPDEYGSGEHCVWHLHIDAAQPTELVFRHLEIEWNPQCLYDYIQIEETPTTGTYSGRFCGSVLPEPIRVEAGDVTVTFHADESINGRGFELLVKPAKSGNGQNQKSRATAKLSGGEIVGLTTAVVIVVIAAAAVAFVIYRKRRASKVFTPASVSVHSSTAVNAIYGMDSFGDDTSFISSTVQGQKQDHPYENTTTENGPLDDDIAYDTVLPAGPVGQSHIEGSNASIATYDSPEQQGGADDHPVAHIEDDTPQDSHAINTEKDTCIANVNVYDNCEDHTKEDIGVYSTISEDTS